MIKVLSTGCGVQSTAIQLMAQHGELPKPDVLIWADTGDEPTDVVAWQKELQRMAEANGMRWVTTKRKGLGVSDAMVDKFNKGSNSDLVTIPAYVRNVDGSPGGPMNRSCTRDWKVKPINAAIKELLGLGKASRWPKYVEAEVWLGISGDEISRMKHSVDPWMRFWHPLVEEPWNATHAPMRAMCITRDDCLSWIKKHGYPEPPRSACWHCPFHSNYEWKRIRDTMPGEWAKAVALDEWLRTRRDDHTIGNINGIAYLHKSMTPLATVELDGIPGQMSFLDECAGVCGV